MVDLQDAYTFSNHGDLPPIPRDTLTDILRHWDNTTDESNTYLQYFAPDATLIFGGEHHGRDNIRACRDSMIHPTKGPIVKCQHFFEKALTLGNYDNKQEGKDDQTWEIIGIANVKYTLTNGKEVITRAASLAKVAKGEEGRWMAQRYEVFMDGSELMKEIGLLH